MTKIVMQFPSKLDYSVRREQNAYIIQVPNPIRTRAADQTFTSPLLDRVLVRENQIVVNLASREIAGDAYAIENPFRIVLDLQRGVSTVPETQPSLPGAIRRPAHAPGVRTIVLDPGHGGKEVGAIGPNGLVEKETTLEICRRLQSLLASELGVRVILTRDSDELVPHDQRTAIANQFRADLFLSIHLNASHSPAARGAETYFLSLEASDELARAAAERENAVLGGASSPGVSSDLNLILWDLAHQEYLRESSRLANLIQSEMNVTSGIQNRGVKQAPFRVLIGATMPSALVEVGFISNPQEEARLASAEHQNEIAQAILRAVRRYKEEYEARLGGGAADPARVGSAPPTVAPAPAPSDRSGR
jgi:N-acetylmuramoyl-L-alanine amidase